MNFIDLLKDKASEQKKRIVLPEGMDERTYHAAEIILKEQFADIIILATPQQYEEYGKEYNIEGATLINPKTAENTKKYAQELFELRRSKGMTIEDATALITSDFMYYACLMLRMGDADGVVSGACHSSANTLRPALQIVKTSPDSKLVSAFFLMCVQNRNLGSNGVFVMGDCGLNQNPTSEQLADIAASSARSFEQLVGDTARVAMLSHSSHGSASHEDVDKVVEATKIANREYPQYLIDGELQTDAAVVPEVAKLKAPQSKVAGRANVLIFPDLDAGNIGYKLVERLGNAEAYGPLCQGIAKPVNDLSRGCKAEDIVGVVAITAIQAQSM